MTRTRTNAREKIVTAAYDLFYKQGYQATTVDQVIERSGVSRPTVYSYFSTKEDLCVAYIKERRQRELESLKECVDKEKTDKEKFMSVIRFVGKNIIDSNFRGCGFYNMISEIPDEQSPIVKEAKIFVDRFRMIIKDMLQELKSSDMKYKNLNVAEMADSYYVIVCGTIMASQEYRKPWPIDRALVEVERLIPA